MSANTSFAQMLFRLFLALPGVLIYAFGVYIMAGGSTSSSYSLIDWVQYVVLAPGLIPLLCWIAAILLSDSKTIGRLLLVAVLSTAFHYVLFAVGAHGERTTYWLLQALEFLFLVPVVVVLRKRRLMALSSS